MKTQCNNSYVKICFFITFLDLQEDITQNPFFLNYIQNHKTYKKRVMAIKSVPFFSIFSFNMFHSHKYLAYYTLRCMECIF